MRWSQRAAFSPASRPARVSAKIQSMAASKIQRAARRSLIRQVKKEIVEEAETKTTRNGYTLLPSPITAATSSLAGNIIMVSPTTTGTTNSYQIGLGTDLYQRVGYKVEGVKAVLKYNIVPNAYNAVTNPNPKGYVCRVFLLRSKQNPCVDPATYINDFITGTGSANFFKYADSGGAGFTGGLQDLNRVVDTDNYELLAYKTHKVGWAANSGTGAVANQQNFTSNDFKMFIQDQLSYKVKAVKFDRAGAVQTPYVFALMQCIACDGGTSSVYQPVTWSCNVTCDYRDV